MKTYLLIPLLLVGSSAAFAQGLNQNSLAADLYMRLLIRDVAAAVQQNSGSQLTRKLCAKFEQTLAVENMSKNITETAWTKASAAEKNRFKKSYLMFLVAKGMDRIGAGATVTSTHVKESGTTFAVTAQIRADKTRTVTYWLAATKRLNNLNADELAKVADAFNGRGKINSAVAAKIANAFRVYRFKVQGRDAVTYIRAEYRIYTQNKALNKLYPEFFSEREGVSGSCP